ncbi:methionyl-tRNA formyltransferase [Denitrobaculum tricleocarpae]|uniref:Methionyl-tRNA formyltransferase n=1 Tax=Denitrobaculum tricleocarpae TaxID=2591009 RepID=A0A545T3U1_9PROT|nr:methionyl-tRNA formyltransferase [Denitrobaculum tricleocarpae]TQV71874.1 methionyl-tRNA formyltransferase [Denitrobaculum tricleocarpae]
MSLRWAFAGCKPQAIRVLTALEDRGFVPVFVASMPEAPESDRAELAGWCAARGVELLETSDLRDETARLQDLDLLLVCRFNLLSEEVFSAPRLGSLNIHSSLLPAYRGVHPVSWVLINGERETGVTLHRIDPGVDTGGILAARAISIADHHDLWSLTGDLDNLSAALAVEVFEYIEKHGTLPKEKQQQGESSYAPRRRPEDGRIDWSLSARSIFNFVRALPEPLPSAFAVGQEGREIRVKEARLSAVHRASDALPGEVLACSAGGWFEVACGAGDILKCRSEPPVTLGERLA